MNTDELHLDGIVPALDLVNSEFWYGLGPLEDRLTSPRWRRGFLARWGFRALPAPTAAEYAVLTGLRRLLRRLVERRAVSSKEVRELNRYMDQPASQLLRRSQDGYELALRPVTAEGWAWVAASVAASFAELA